MADKAKTGMPVVSPIPVLVGQVDNVKRGIRTGGQVVAGFLVSVPVIDVWNNFTANHAIHDPTLKFAIGVILTALVAWAHNQIEDKTGHSVLAPTDRQAGDALARSGLGAKTGKIVGDESPATITKFVRRKTIPKAA